MSDKKRLVIAGGGAAGFFAAINAALLCPDLEVIIFEKTHKLLSKVRISGGGRCNVTHHCFEPPTLSQHYPRGYKELLSAFYQFGPQQMISWLAQRHVKLKVEEDGRMFPVSDSSETVIDCFLSEAKNAGVKIITGVGVSSFMKTENLFQISLSDQTIMQSNYLLIATGGHPNAKGYDPVSKNTEHGLVPPVPSLFTFNIPDSPFKGLEGVATEAEVKFEGFSYSSIGPLLFTHWGISGPAVLKLSAYAARWLAQHSYNANLEMNFVPGHNEHQIKESIEAYRKLHPRLIVHNFKIFEGIPQRLWQRLCVHASINDQVQAAHLTKKQMNNMVLTLMHFKTRMMGKTTFKEEFVTSGGVALHEINMKTMESKKVSGLFFAGEVIDVDGITGGFNFQAAWTTAMLAAKQIAAKCQSIG
jgi:predicted Rossmann fold flavoprotein